MGLEAWRDFPGEVVFDGNMENNPDKIVLFVKASKDENEAQRIANFYKNNDYKKIFTNRRVRNVETAVAKPGTNDEKLYTLIIIIELHPWNPNSKSRYGGNTRKNKNTRKNYKKK
jgi:hypothetical protein